MQYGYCDFEISLLRTFKTFIFFNHVPSLRFGGLKSYYYAKLYEKNYIHALHLRKL